PEVWLSRAGVFAQLRDHDRAEADLARAIEVRPDDPNPRITRGRFHAERGEQPRADADFTSAARLTSDDLNRFLEAGWWVAGPYPRDLKLPCPPEVDADPSRPVAAYSALPMLPVGSPTAGLDL